ncbi:Endonuclease/exonuclease/phosphatase [Macleaya cordata]|uniref:poly(A)-specific ribonuclease n=1 Tax=Macleaya cordata TaxID=56857 RepID=A0A200PMA1_MACCD|nr:Endonuclease/exonuclease/phosphatase [Macleaya cordata]
MPYELRVSLRSETPVVGYELNPSASCYSTDLTEIPNYSFKFNWYRLQSDERIICSVHHFEIATFQCMCCVTLKIPIKESYHCSAKCFFDKWQNHRIRHLNAAAALCRTKKGDDQSFKSLRSCGSWPSLGSWSSFEKCSVINMNAVMVEGGGGSWLKVGSSKTYIPSMDDFGYKLKLESQAIDCKEGNLLTPMKVIVMDPVIVAPVPSPRYMIPIGPLDGFSNFSLESRACVAGTFSVLSYNVLADFYVNKEIYNFCPTWALTWEYRRQNLLREIIGYKADIICLQEVQSDHFEDFFKPELVKRGYSVVYKKKTVELYTGKYTSEGCATFFLHDRFRENEKYELEFGKIARTVVESLKPSQRTIDCGRLMKDNVALIVILEAMENGAVSDTLDYRICVANTHVSANPYLTDVKLWQVATLINGLEEIADSHIPVLICGDLNSLPGSAPHDLLIMGSVNHNHEELAGAPVEIFQHLKLSHQLPLVSAYSSLSRTYSGDSISEQQQIKMNPETNEPHFTIVTPYFLGAIDYIFYTADRLAVEGLLELLDVQSATKYTALPSPLWSSDHIALMAKFSLKPASKDRTS